jgi:hypothetical protein
MDMQEIASPQLSEASVTSYPNLRHFQKGVSGNPGGRPKGEDVRALARKNTKKAMERIVELIESDDERVALMAAKEVLDRAYGKPKASDDDKADKRSVTINIVKLHGDRDNAPPPVEAEAVSVRTLALSGDGG